MDSELDILIIQDEELIKDIDDSSCDIGKHEATMIETQLKLLDIHFNWDLVQEGPHGETSNVIVSRLEEKAEELCESMEFKFRNFCLQLTISQELMKYDTSNGLKKIKECEQTLTCLKSNNCKEYSFTSIVEALDYIVMGCKAFALFKCGMINETKEILQNIPDCSKMDEKQRSGIYGLKAYAFMEYGIQGLLKALEYINIAREKNPMMAEWHFMSSKIMGRIRRIKFPFLGVSDEEQSLCLTAYKLDPENSSYMLYVAQNLREKAFNLYSGYRDDVRNHLDCKKRADSMNGEASALYKKLINSNQSDPHILCRSAFGIVKLPFPHKCVDLAVKAIERSLEISPNNPMANHYAGLIYHRHLKDYDRGLKYLEIGANLNNYGSLSDLIKLRVFLDRKNYDPVPDLTKALEYKDNSSNTLSQIASWYFFNKDDLLQAWKFLKNTADDPSSRKHKSYFLRMNDPCDLVEVVFDEVKLKLAKCKYQNDQEKETLMTMALELGKLCPLSHPHDYNDLKAIILNKSAQLVDKEQNPKIHVRGKSNNRNKFYF